MAVALAVVLAAFSVFISPESVRQQVIERAASLTGLEVVVRGPTRLSLFPDPRFELSDVTFREAGRPDAPPLATTDRLIGTLDVWRLLTGRLSADSFKLVRPRITLVREADGTENWRAGSGGILGHAALAPEGEPVPAVRVGRIGIEDGQVLFVDRRSDTREEVSALSGEVNWPRLASWAEGKLSGVWRGEIFDAGFSANVPLRLMRGGRGGLQLNASTAGASLHFRGQAAAGADLQLNGQFNLKAGSLRKLVELMGTEFPDGPGFNEMSVSGDLHLVNKVASVSDAEVSLDGNQADGTLELDLSSSVPALRGTLASDTLDLTVYHPAPDGDDAAARPLLDRQLDPNHLDRLEADVRFSAARVLLGEMTLGRTAATVTSRRGSFVLGIGETELYDGIGAGTLSLAKDAGTARWDCVVALDGVEVQPLFQALVGLGQVRGEGSLRLNASGRGHTLRQVMRNMAGNGSMEVKGGSIAGIEAQRVAQALASGRLEDLPAAPKGASQFQELAASFKFDHGAAMIEHMELDAGALSVTGTGTVALPETTIDATATVRLTDEPSGTEAIPEMPLVIRGTLAQPRVYPPTKWLMQRAAPTAVAIDPIRFEPQLRRLLRGTEMPFRGPLGLR